MVALRDLRPEGFSVGVRALAIAEAVPSNGDFDPRKARVSWLERIRGINTRLGERQDSKVAATGRCICL